MAEYHRSLREKSKKGLIAMLVDLIVHGGNLLGNGEATPVSLQAATQRAKLWIEALAARIGEMIDGVLTLRSSDDIALAFAEMPEEFIAA